MTEFGKYARKIRIENKENMRDMAKNIGVSAAFLSATEVGKKKIPLKWIEIISNIYRLSEKQKLELEQVIHITNKQVSINLENLSKEEKELSIMFARTIENVKPDTLEKLRKILEEDD